MRGTISLSKVKFKPLPVYTPNSPCSAVYLIAAYPTSLHQGSGCIRSQESPYWYTEHSHKLRAGTDNTEIVIPDGHDSLLLFYHYVYSCKTIQLYFLQFQKLTNRSNYIIIAFKFKVMYSYCLKYSYIALAIALYLQLGVRVLKGSYIQAAG